MRRLRAFLAVLRTPGCLVAIAFVAGAIALGRWVDSIGGPEALLARYGWWAPLASVPVHTVLAVSPFPSELFAIANGAAYGWVAGGVLSWLAWTLASALEYELARRSVRDADVDRWFERMPGWLKRLPVDHPAFLIVGRWLPYGFHVVNVLAGVRRVSLVRHLWCAAVGSVPGAILFPGMGAGIHWF